MSEATDQFWVAVLEKRGFRRIAELRYRHRAELWWHADLKVQMLLYVAGGALLAKGSKSYFMKSISEEGEVYARDLNALHEYLESHFTEVHILFTHFRDIPERVAARRIAETRPGPPGTGSGGGLIEKSARMEQMRSEYAAAQKRLHDFREQAKLDQAPSPLMRSYFPRRAAEFQSQVEALRTTGQALEAEIAGTRHLLKEYLRKGRAACFMFIISSNLQTADGPDNFRDKLEVIVKEMNDLHRYQVSQKLQGGRLQVYVEEMDEPVLAWQVMWAGGALNPRQLESAGPAVEDLTTETNRIFMVTPSEDVVLGGSVKDERKILGAWVLRNILTRLDRCPRPDEAPEAVPEGTMPIWVGQSVGTDGTPTGPAVFPLDQIENVDISGTTGSGKSCLARVLVEGAAAYEDVNILVIDPRNQWVSIRVAEDRENILRLYSEFGLRPGQARGFDFTYFAPGADAGRPLPSDLSALAHGRTVVSLKELDDRQRCETAARILEATFKAHSVRESETVRTLIVLEEAQRITKKRVAEDATEAAERAERALDMTVREGRKYGLRVFLVSQTIRDFAYGAATIRQNTNTKIFLRNSDREVDYAADFLDDGRQIIGLKPGMAICYNAQWGARTFRVRPPFSKVWEPSTMETRKLVNGPMATAVAPLSPDAQRLLELVRRRHGGPEGPLNLTDAAIELRITSKRQLLEMVSALERQGLIKTTQLRARGQPRVLLPISGLE